MQKLAINGGVKLYDANCLAGIAKNATPDLRTNTKYTNAKFRFIDETMSCNRQEAIAWMKHYMSEALTGGIDTKDKSWQYSFIAAYDLYNELCAAC